MAHEGRRPIDPTRQRANQRERALDRLSRLTTATAIAGTFATIGFGGLAALTYAGTPTTNDPIAIDDAGQQGAVGTAQPNDTNTSATQAPTTRQFVPAQPPSTTTRRRTHVSSGGSG
jgi:hypothetical protein